MPSWFIPTLLFLTALVITFVAGIYGAGGAIELLWPRWQGQSRLGGLSKLLLALTAMYVVWFVVPHATWIRIGGVVLGALIFLFLFLIGVADEAEERYQRPVPRPD